MATAALAVLAAALCLSACSDPPLSVASLATTQITLRWQHSIEKIAWEEDYVVAGSWLMLSGARIQGSGAGMEPPSDAVLQGGFWHYRVPDPWRRSLVLARSEFVRDYGVVRGCKLPTVVPLDPRGSRNHYAASVHGAAITSAEPRETFVGWPRCAIPCARRPSPPLSAPARSR